MRVTYLHCGAIVRVEDHAAHFSACLQARRIAPRDNFAGAVLRKAPRPEARS